jgi:hypothetical protein
MAEVSKKMEKVLPSSIYEGTPFVLPEETRQKTMDEKLAELDAKVAKIEGLREAGRPEEIRIKNLDMKYGRTGRHPAYPWYGSEVAYADRLPHLADRLGKYSEMGSTNTVINDWLEMKSDQVNPLFHSFFVSEPSKEPDPDVNFEKGDVIYENPYAFQAGNLAKQTGLGGLIYVLCNVFHTLLTNRTVYPIYNEGMDHRADGFDPIHNYASGIYSGSFSDWHDIETLGNVVFIAPLFPLAMASFGIGLKMMTDGVVTKMQFNKNRDLVFVSKVGGTFFAKEIEEVYETTHLQVLPPSVKTGFEGVSTRAIFRISCMASHESFSVYTNPQYWNPELKEEFQDHLHHLWEE